MTSITNFLKENADRRYSEFIKKLTPNSRYDALGVRVPVLRSLAADILKSDECDEFLSELPHKYREENIIHAVILNNYSRDYQITLQKVMEFLPYADSWEFTDLLPPKVFAKHTEELYPHILDFIKSEDEFVVRFGVVCMMKYYLSDKIFDKKIFDEINSIKADKYYIQMAIAWFWSEALLKQYDAAVPYIERGLPDKKLHNKAIQKALESSRISEETKIYLKNLKK